VLEGLFQPLHLVVILTVVLIIFGPGKLPELGHALGKTLREFREAMSKMGESSDASSMPRAIERENVVRCTNCGTSNSPSNNFCGSCGRAIGTSVAVTDGSSASAQHHSADAI